MDKIKLAGEVAQIARRAGAAILSVYANVDVMPVELKSDYTPLTLADKAANDIIASGLVQLAERFPIVSEESAEIPYEVRKGYACYWLVDPLDGTKEFLKHNGEFTVNIALVEGEVPTIGVVYVPVTDELYWAVAGEGAYLEKWKNGKMESGKMEGWKNGRLKLEAAAFGMEEVGLKVLCSRSHLNAETQAFIDGLKEPHLVEKGSALKFLLLAKGEAHLYPRMGLTNEWDTCPAQLILEEAGGKVVDWETGEGMKYNKEELANHWFVAYGRVKG